MDSPSLLQRLGFDRQPRQLSTRAVMVITAIGMLVIYAFFTWLRSDCPVYISGAVCDAADNPIPHALIAVEYDPKVYPDRAVFLLTADSAGSFEIHERVPRRVNGRLRLGVAVQGYLPVEKSYTLPVFVFDRFRMFPENPVAP